MIRFPVSRHSGREQLSRHRHKGAYAAVVLRGGYIEAGVGARFTAEAGQVVFHGAHEAHRNQFGSSGATVLNLPLPPATMGCVGHVDDLDAIIRLAELDVSSAASILIAGLRLVTERHRDWPDDLADDLIQPDFPGIACWADQVGLAAQSVSRGFRLAYGVTPKRYRLEARTLRAIAALRDSRTSLAVLAVETGFADQAHLTRAVVELTRVTPAVLRVQSVQEGAAYLR